MLGLDELFESKILAGVAFAAGAAIIAPVVLPVVLGVARPVVKSAIKAGIVLYDRGLESAAEIREVMEDLVAEVRSELHATAAKAEPAPPEAPGEAKA